MTRIFGCQGSIQLVAAAVAGEACLEGERRGVRDYLVLHDLALPERQQEDFARILTRMAPLTGTWERIVYLPPSTIQHLDAHARTDGRRGLLARFAEHVGTDHADELYLTQNRIPTNHLLLNAYRDARKICYGDGIGVNFSHEYFHRPADVPREQPSPQPSRLRALARTGRDVLRRLRRIGTSHDGWMREVPFDLHCLLLPNLFDETVADYRLTDPQAYVRLFARLSDLLDGESAAASACRQLTEALAVSSQAVILLTSNFSEALKMDREHEIGGYLEMIAADADPDAALIIKPHPRDGVDKIAELRDRLARSFRQVVVLDDPLLFYLTFEVIWAKYFDAHQRQARALPTRVVCFSSACLALEYLYGVPCTIGFGEDRVRRLFHPQWIAVRLRHEADLGRAVEAIRASRSHNTELTTVTQNIQSGPLSPVVPKARWRNGTYTTRT